MGAGAILQGLLNSATAARTGQLQGQQIANQKATTDAIQQIVQQRAQDAAEIERRLKSAQAGEADARTNLLLHPPAKAPEYDYQTDQGGNVVAINKNDPTDVKPIMVNGQPFKAKVPNRPSSVFQGPHGEVQWVAQGDPIPAGFKPYAPPQAPQIMQGTDPTGGPAFFRVPKFGGPAEPVSGMTPNPTGGGASGLSGLTMQTMARMGTSFNDLSQAVDQMDRMENDPAFRAKLTAYNKALMAGAEAQPNAEAHGIGGMLSNMAGQLASGKAQQSLDPDLNTYLNLKQRVGTAFTELLPRPNQQLLQIEKGLSGIDVGWNPELLKGIQARRQGGLNVLRNILSHQGMLDENGQVSGTPTGGRGGGGGAPRQSAPPTTEQALWDAAVAKYGKQKVLQEYGPRPGGE